MNNSVVPKESITSVFTANRMNQTEKLCWQHLQRGKLRSMAWHDTPRNKIREQLDNETKINKNNNNTILQHDTPLEKIQITARKYT